MLKLFLDNLKTFFLDWKLRIIYLETTGLGLAFISSTMLFSASFVSQVCERRKVCVALSILSILMSVTAGEIGYIGSSMFYVNDRITNIFVAFVDYSVLK